MDGMSVYAVGRLDRMGDELCLTNTAFIDRYAALRYAADRRAASGGNWPVVSVGEHGKVSGYDNPRVNTAFLRDLERTLGLRDAVQFVDNEGDTWHRVNDNECGDPMFRCNVSRVSVVTEPCSVLYIAVNYGIKLSQDRTQPVMVPDIMTVPTIYASVIQIESDGVMLNGRTFTDWCAARDYTNRCNRVAARLGVDHEWQTVVVTKYGRTTGGQMVYGPLPASVARLFGVVDAPVIRDGRGQLWTRHEVRGSVARSVPVYEHPDGVSRHDVLFIAAQYGIDGRYLDTPKRPSQRRSEPDRRQCVG